MDTNIDIKDIDKINSSKLHVLTPTTESTSRLLCKLTLFPTKLNDNDSCPKGCNDWYTGKNK